jgi:hypothetical protein
VPWPTQPQGYGHAPAPQTQGYHFPPPEPPQQPNYGYSNPQLLGAQQWPQQNDPPAYELNYQAYSPGDPGPFHQGAHGQHPQQGFDPHLGYGDGDLEYGEDFYEDEEPRRGPRWLLIAGALVAAIGLGGALAYTYRSFVAPHHGRVTFTKNEPTVKVKPDQVASAPAKPVEESPAPTVEPPQPAAPDDAATENMGPKPVKVIPIAPGGPIPGITLYQPPQPQGGPQPQAAAEPPANTVQPPPRRVTIGTRPVAPPAVAPDEETPAATPAPPPVKRPVQTASVTPKASPAAPPKVKEPSSGLGYVAVLATKKARMDAMTAFADLQQKYTDVLGDKSFDVQEADLSARGLGTMYRLVVGPPGSHTYASNLCAQLKSAGYVGCWVKEY